MPKIQSFVFREVTQRCPLLCCGLLKHISTSVDIHSTVDELLESMFSNPSVTKLCKENQHDPKPELSNTETLGRIPIIGGCNKAMGM